MLTGYIEYMGQTLVRYDEVADIFAIVEEHLTHRRYP